MYRDHAVYVTHMYIYIYIYICIYITNKLVFCSRGPRLRGRKAPA